jgi:hypothetical protein
MKLRTFVALALAVALPLTAGALLAVAVAQSRRAPVVARANRWRITPWAPPAGVPHPTGAPIATYGSGAWRLLVRMTQEGGSDEIHGTRGAWLVSGSGQESFAFALRQDGPSDLGAGGVAIDGPRLVAWVAQPEGGHLDAAAVRADDPTQVVWQLHLRLVPIPRDHHCRLTVCDSSFHLVLQGERVPRAVVLESDVAQVFELPSGRSRGMRVHPSLVALRGDGNPAHVMAAGVLRVATCDDGSPCLAPP